MNGGFSKRAAAIPKSSSIGPRNVTERNHKQIEFTFMGTNVAKKT